MGSLPQVVPWIPEDDLLLKNSVQAGASLEALAKGAVQFSRRFSIGELEDRWRALLYDPVVSAEVSFRMTDLERSNPNFPAKFSRTGYSKENKSSSRKRDREKIRSIYHSLRKKFRTEPFSSLDLDFLDDSHFMDNAVAHFGLEDFNMDSTHNAFPDTLADGGCVGNHVVSQDNLQGDSSHVGGENLTFTEHRGPSECDTVHQDSEQKPKNAARDPKTTIASTDCYLAQPSDSGFKDVEPFMDVDGKEVDKSYYDGPSPLLSLQCEPVPDSYGLDSHPEVVGGVICCLLNQEYPDIPRYDDIPLSYCHPKSVFARRHFKVPNNPTTTCVRDISSSKGRIEGYSLNSQKKIPRRLQGRTQGKSDIGQPSQGSANVCLDTQLPGISGAKANKEVAGGTIFGNEAQHAKDVDDDLIEIADPDLEINRTETEAEAHVSESDEDLPNYSDVEAMILDMDLDPDDQDNFDLEVAKYQSEDMKRKIIRLEQAADSYMQRAIASHRALAVLYGRHSKHYIKKPEVLIGRSTEDIAVDIDLGKEERGSRISRRQAILRLHDDGNFHMINLGKYAISVNEKVVDPEQSLILKSDCLIEIRGMPFIFETNQRRIEECLKSTGKGI